MLFPVFACTSLRGQRKYQTGALAQRAHDVPHLSPSRTTTTCFAVASARYVIALLVKSLRVRIVDETGPEIVNFVPSKFLEKFETLELARAQLQGLASFGSMDIELRQVSQ